MGTNDLAAAVLGAIGDNDVHQEPKIWISTGFSPLNKAISGHYDRGFPSGRLVEMFGPPSSGKTAIATMAMISAQKMGGIACFWDHERSFDVRLAEKMGLDTTPGKWVFKTPRTFEESLNMGMRLAEVVRKKGVIPDTAPILNVYDSLASMVPHEKFAAMQLALEKGENSEAINMRLKLALATATSQSFPALQVWCEQHEMTTLFLNQARTKPGVMYGDPTTTPGGNAPEYYASVRIKLGRSMIVSSDKKSKLGQRIGAECVKNKVSRPFMKAEWDFLFQEDGTGKFDVTGSTIDHLNEIGALEKAGNYIVWDGKKFYRNQLVELIDAEDRYAELDKLLPRPSAI